MRNFHFRPGRLKAHLVAVLVLLAGLFSAVPEAPAQISPDRTLRLERIEVEPVSSGLEAAVTDLLNLSPGDEVDAEALRAARRRLQLSGWFEEVEVYTERGSVPGLLILRVETKLDRRVRVETGFGHDPFWGWALKIVGLRADHLLGTASTTQIGWQIGTRRSMLEADYVGRRIGGHGFDLLVHFEGISEDWNAFEGEDFFQQKIERSGLAVGTRWYLQSGLYTTFWLGVSAADPGQIKQLEGERRDPPADLVGPPRGQENYSNLGLDLTIDRRDLAQPWRRGLWSTLQFRSNRVRDGDRFGIVRGALRTALPLPGETALAWRVDATWSGPSTPYHLRPFFGGQGSVRGFRDASLSGGEGARSVFATALEWRAPLLPRKDGDARVHGALFIDTGTWVDADGSANDWATSVGWGLRLRLPWIERLSIDMAVPLTPTATGDPFWVHFGLGFGF